jgi:hypothetical protein
LPNNNAWLTAILPGPPKSQTLLLFTGAAHYIIKGKTVLQTMEETDVAYHAGDERNYHAFGLEVM